MNYQWNSIGNPVKNPIQISMKYQWKSIGNFNEIPVEILMKYQKKIHWKSS